MVRNIVIFGGSSHPQLTETICNHLGIPPAKIFLGKFAVGETRVEVEESVRGKDVYIIQSGGGKVNDHLMELLITISACKTASANRVTAVLPLFPYSRQSDIPYNKTGAPLARIPSKPGPNHQYTFDTVPQTPALQHTHDHTPTGYEQQLHGKLSNLQLNGDSHHHSPHSASNHSPTPATPGPVARDFQANSSRRSTLDSDFEAHHNHNDSSSSSQSGGNHHTASHSHHHSHHSHSQNTVAKAAERLRFQPQRGYKQWVAQAGTLIANLLTCAGADHVITMDLHDPQYQGFFDIPVDNLYGRHILRKYIKHQIPHYQEAVVVSPDAGGAKRATAIADSLGMSFALIHKERRPTQITDRQNASMMLVGDVAGKTCVLVDDLADTSNTITRAAKLLKKEGATAVIALITHGVLSGDAIERINQSALDKVVVTNTVDQSHHKRRCPKLEVLDVGTVFAEAIRRVHHGESISVLFQYD